MGGGDRSLVGGGWWQGRSGSGGVGVGLSGKRRGPRRTRLWSLVWRSGLEVGGGAEPRVAACRGGVAACRGARRRSRCWLLP
ncbi:unnamed protein product [Linum trigynum]|uniref:Uncharacterized protein n=1 Tax=Linum trigynum TaxID=586398 RepID=A0AAV2FTL5_9ROSI